MKTIIVESSDLFVSRGNLLNKCRFHGASQHLEPQTFSSRVLDMICSIWFAPTLLSAERVAACYRLSLGSAVPTQTGAAHNKPERVGRQTFATKCSCKHKKTISASPGGGAKSCNKFKTLNSTLETRQNRGLGRRPRWDIYVTSTTLALTGVRFPWRQEKGSWLRF